MPYGYFKKRNKKNRKQKKKSSGKHEKKKEEKLYMNDILDEDTIYCVMKSYFKLLPECSFDKFRLFNVCKLWNRVLLEYNMPICQICEPIYDKFNIKLCCFHVNITLHRKILSEMKNNNNEPFFIHFNNNKEEVMGIINKYKNVFNLKITAECCNGKGIGLIKKNCQLHGAANPVRTMRI